MKKETEFYKVPKEWKRVIELSWHVIENKHLLKFYYESKPKDKNKEGNKGYRTIRPYMVIPIGENLKLVGLPITELSKPIEERQPGHYIISQLKERLESEEFKILPKTFDDPGVERRIVVATQTPPICRFIYDDEDPAKVKAQWLKIKYYL